MKLSKIATKSFQGLQLCGLLLVSVAVCGQTLAPPALPTRGEDLLRQVSLIEAVDDAQLSSNSLFEVRFGLPSTVDRSSEDSDRSTPSTGSVELVQPQTETSKDLNVKFRVANQEALLFTGIQHAFNITTEAGTRDALNGHWLQDYLHSVGELRGWSDGDKFMAPYVGHTLEGSIFGFILRQNDPRYRAVQWGDGRDYFVSVLRSLAFSAVWHTQWKIGPISEASIGNVMLHASPGFITLTNTPTLGTVELMAEDAADRYLIMGLENRSTNAPLLILTRCFLNPGRTFANIMAFRVPWHRETRIGLLRDNRLIRKEFVKNYRETGEKGFEYVRPQRTDVGIYPKEAPIELSAFPLYQSFLGGGSCVGGGGSGAGRINAHWQYVAEVSGCLIMHMPAANQSGDSLFYGGGVRWVPRASRKVSPFVEVMFGGQKVSHETDDLTLRKRLLAEWNNGNGTLGHYPMRSNWSVEVVRNGPSLKMGSGFEVVVARPFSWRVLDLEYAHTWMDDVMMIHPQNALRIATGAVLRIGTW
ncbi:MAG TPA: hypothetical protein VEI52_18165 [Terriglobales bacterium]|nr:hypothetical protein [Terriglobales bacterium]